MIVQWMFCVFTAINNTTNLKYLMATSLPLGGTRVHLGLFPQHKHQLPLCNMLDLSCPRDFVQTGHCPGCRRPPLGTWGWSPLATQDPCRLFPQCVDGGLDHTRLLAVLSLLHHSGSLWQLLGRDRTSPFTAVCPLGTSPASLTSVVLGLTDGQGCSVQAGGLWSLLWQQGSHGILFLVTPNRLSHPAALG